MRLLDRYLLRELLIPFGYCLAGFLVFWLAFNLVDELSDFQKLRLTGLDVAEYYLVKLPEWLVFPIVQVALLLASLYALTNHSRHHELTAMRAAGLSLGRISLPYFGVGVLGSLGLLALNELWVPRSAERAEEILHRRTKDAARLEAREWERPMAFENTREWRRWVAEACHLASGEMIRPQLYWRLPDGTVRTVSADRARYVEGAWRFTNVTELLYPPRPGALPERSETNLLVLAELSETPEQIRTEIRMSNIRSLRDARRAQFSALEIIEYLQTHPDSGNEALLATRLHGRLAAPWTCLVVVLIAIPFGAASGRRNVYVGVAGSIVICFAYFVALQLSLTLGASGRVPSWLAAWSPNVLFGLGGLALLDRTR
ncbi:MAG TPA: LptF/LptG family permease [Methylomirabilota bacterium]|nr:LptF/LptG family permease [Methylomirabilota bacterium]